MIKKDTVIVFLNYFKNDLPSLTYAWMLRVWAEMTIVGHTRFEQNTIHFIC